jgi:transcriptional regulator with XRE-family HTH domain
MVAVATDREESQVGDRIRALREMRQLSLRAVADEAGMSTSFVSQLERGRTSASIGSLRRIAQALGVSIADLFAEDVDAAPHVLHLQDLPELDTEPGARKFLVTQRPLRHLEVYVGEFEPGASTGDESYTHGDSQEVFIVSEGTVTLTLSGSEHVMSAGDSIEYRTSFPHHVRNTGAKLARVMWICSPVTD